MYCEIHPFDVGARRDPRGSRPRASSSRAARRASTTPTRRMPRPTCSSCSTRRRRRARHLLRHERRSTCAFGGEVDARERTGVRPGRRHASTRVDPLLVDRRAQRRRVWMSHGDRMDAAAATGSRRSPAATTRRSPRSATASGRSTACSSIPRSRTRVRRAARSCANFLFRVCGARPTGRWRTSSSAGCRASASGSATRRVICGLSGGVDSTVVAALDPPRDRRPAHLHLRRQRRCCARDEADAGRGALPRALRRSTSRAVDAGAALPRRTWRASTTPSSKRRIIGAPSSRSSRTRRRSFRDADVPRAGHALSRRHRVGVGSRAVGDDQEPPQRRRPARAHEARAGRAAARALQGRGARARPRARRARARSSAASRFPGPGLACASSARSTTERLAHPARRRRDRAARRSRAPGSYDEPLAGLRRAAAGADRRRDGRRAHLRERRRRSAPSSRPTA